MHARHLQAKQQQKRITHSWGQLLEGIFEVYRARDILLFATKII